MDLARVCRLISVFLRHEIVGRAILGKVQKWRQITPSGRSSARRWQVERATWLVSCGQTSVGFHALWQPMHLHSIKLVVVPTGKKEAEQKSINFFNDTTCHDCKFRLSLSKRSPLHLDRENLSH